MSQSKPVQSKSSKLSDHETVLQFARLSLINKEVLGPYILDKCKEVLDQLAALKAENNALRWQIFYENYNMVRLRLGLQLMNTFSDIGERRYCYCVYCRNLYKQTTARERHDTCQLFPVFERLCQKQGLILVNIEAQRLGYERGLHSISDCVVYNKVNAHFVIQSAGEWDTLGYGKLFVSKKDPLCDEVQQVKGLFNIIRKTFLFSPTGPIIADDSGLDSETDVVESSEDDQDDDEDNTEHIDEPTQPYDVPPYNISEGLEMDEPWIDDH
jgi:hypothetical protein